MNNLVMFLLLVFTLSGVNGQSKIKVLFIGNSLTYSNDLPKLFDEAMAEAGVNSTSTVLAKPNYGLEDHWNDGVAQRLIQKEEFNYVVIQQGPSSQLAGKSSLVKFGGMFKELVDRAGGELVFFMVWPARRYYRTFDGVIANYLTAAEAHEALIAPVGAKLKKYFDEYDDYKFLGADGFHPSPAGSKYAAEIIAQSIFKAQE